MWYVKNERNNKILNKLNAEIIKPLFYIFKEVILINKPNEDSWKLTKTYKSSKYQDVFDYLFSWEKSPINFKECYLEIIQKCSLTELKKHIEIYKYQNQQVNSHNYDFAQQKIKKPFETIFVKIFYEQLFNDEYLWLHLIGEQFSRSKFHENFKEENNINICPYCDIDTTNSTSNNYIEHFLPKGKYPFIALNAYNLISSCGACNLPSEGKGQNVLIPITNPYKQKISDEVVFQIDLYKEEIRVEEKSKNNIPIKNYLDLLKLRKRYACKRIYNQVFSRCKGIYESVSSNENYCKALDGYLRPYEKQIPYFLCVKYLLNEDDLQQYFASKKHGCT